MAPNKKLGKKVLAAAAAALAKADGPVKPAKVCEPRVHRVSILSFESESRGSSSIITSDPASLYTWRSCTLWLHCSVLTSVLVWLLLLQLSSKVFRKVKDKFAGVTEHQVDTLLQQLIQQDRYAAVCQMCCLPLCSAPLFIKWWQPPHANCSQLFTRTSSSILQCIPQADTHTTTSMNTIYTSIWSVPLGRESIHFTPPPLLV